MPVGVLMLIAAVAFVLYLDRGVNGHDVDQDKVKKVDPRQNHLT